MKHPAEDEIDLAIEKYIEATESGSWRVERGAVELFTSWIEFWEHKVLFEGVDPEDVFPSEY